MPSTSSVAREKDYCDLLYAWLQCNSDRVNMNENGRRIHKTKIKWTAIEKDFTRLLFDGIVEKVISRKTIAKYYKIRVAVQKMHRHVIKRVCIVQMQEPQ